MMDNLIIEVGALVGFSALVSLLVNVLKYFGVVKDGTADKWVAGFNFAGILALFVTRLFIPEFDPIQADGVMAEVAAVGVYILNFVIMIFGSKVTYAAVKGLPVVGKTFSG